MSSGSVDLTELARRRRPPPSPAGWMTDLINAADELGYGVSEIRPKSITLVCLAKPELEVRIESYFLSADLLRSTILAQKR